MTLRRFLYRFLGLNLRVLGLNLRVLGLKGFRGLGFKGLGV